MQLINHYSLLILALLFLASAAYLLLRRGSDTRKVFLLAGLLAGVVIVWLVIRPRATPVANTGELLAQIGMGKPVLIEFQSPY